MSSFVDRPGVPLLTFANPEPAGIPVTQKRFYLDPGNAGDKRDEAQAGNVSSGWTIPVCPEDHGHARLQARLG